MTNSLFKLTTTPLLIFYINYLSNKCGLELKQKEIEDEAEQILSKYSGNYTALYNIIKYDKDECSLQGRRKSFRMLIPCSIPQIIKALSEVRLNRIYFNPTIFLHKKFNLAK